jgi:TorA maturation chaperone TorD
MNKNQDIQQTKTEQANEERAALYLLLSRLFADQSISNDLDQYLELLSSYKNGASGLAAGLSSKLTKWQKKDHLDHLLKTEYARVFILAGGIRPYQSVYLGESRMLMQEPWLEVKKYYHKCGLKLDNPSLHPEDHASVEFAFMVYLLEHDKFEAAEEFFRQHLYQWIPGMLKDLSEYPYAYFYRDIAEFGISFIEKEYSIFNSGNIRELYALDQLQRSDS